MIPISALAWGVALACGWGLSAFFARRVVGEVGAQQVTVWIQLIGTLFLALVTSTSGLAVPSPGIVGLALGTTLLGWLSLVMLYEGLRVGVAGVVLTFAACGPLVPIVLAALILGETVRPVTWVGIGLIFCGIAILSTTRSEGTAPSTGAIWGLGNLVLGGLSLFCFKLTVSASSADFSLIWIKGSGVVLYGGFVLWSLFKSRSLKPLYFSRSSWLGLFVAGACDATAGMALAQGYALSLGTAIVSALGALYPVVTSLLVWWWQGEGLSRRQVLGMALAMTGAIGLSLL